MPSRGWFNIEDGRDQEFNLPVPDYVVWPEPSEMPWGVDRQIGKAVEVPGEEVNKVGGRPTPVYRISRVRAH